MAWRKQCRQITLTIGRLRIWEKHILLENCLPPFMELLHVFWTYHLRKESGKHWHKRNNLQVESTKLIESTETLQVYEIGFFYSICLGSFIYLVELRHWGSSDFNVWNKQLRLAPLKIASGRDPKSSRDWILRNAGLLHSKLDGFDVCHGENGQKYPEDANFLHNPTFWYMLHRLKLKSQERDPVLSKA